MTPLEDQVILVTGATDGLGRGVAQRLVEAGATVLVHGRDDERGAATGRYFDGLREARPGSQAADEVARRRLRDLSDDLAGLG